MYKFRYDDVADANQQLDRTVVMTEMGIPYYIRYYDEWQWNVLAVGDNPDNVELFDIRTLGIVFDPVQLGYMNNGDNMEVAYLTRVAVRMWKQGLNTGHLKAKTGYIPDNILKSSHLANTVLNNYPSLPESYSRIKEFGGAVAFHRDFAFTAYNYPAIALEYKGDEIGNVTNEGDFDIDDKFFFVKEQLEEILHAEN